MTQLRVHCLEYVWPGLRSFVDDGELVAGYDDAVPGFFWAAAQGGYGIQTAPAAGQLYAAMLLGAPPPDEIMAWGVAPTPSAPPGWDASAPDPLP